MSLRGAGFRWPMAMRCALVRVGVRTILSLGMIGTVAWGFVGSLAMGLRTPQSSQARMVWLWLVGLALIVVLSGFGAWCTGEHAGRSKPDPMTDRAARHRG